MSKWKYAKLLLPLVVAVVVYFVADSMKINVVSGTSDVVQSEKIQTEEISTIFSQQDLTQQKEFINCDSIVRSVYPNEKTIASIWSTIFNQIDDQKVSDQNMLFLNSLRNIEKDTLVIFQPFQGVYSIFDQPIAVIREIEHQVVDGKWKTKSPELNIIYDNIPDFKDSIQMDKLKVYDGFLEKKTGKENLHIYAFNQKERVRIEVGSIGVYLGECIEYTSFSLDTKDTSMLFGSSFKLSLEFGAFSKINELLQQISLDGCRDCPDGIDNMKVFAQLEGVDDLYFAYSDHMTNTTGFPHLPSRALVYVSETGKVQYLIVDEVDVFGCSCL